MQTPVGNDVHLYRARISRFDGSVSESLRKYWRYCRMYGIKNATRLALRRLRKPKGAPPTTITPLASSPPINVPVVPIEKTISVVIPTKNAGPDLALLLRKLIRQSGISRCEFVVVDSGSSDDTVAIAKGQGARTIEIKPSDFTHALARNLGAHNASGDYLLFMVQDALPLTDLWLWDMVTALQSNSLAAVSCAEYPRSDSDLFYQFLIHQQYHSVDRDRIMVWNDSCASYLGLRFNAQLSDIAMLIRRDVFEQYRYRTAYAEDLDLGIRLIRDGHQLGFLHRTRVLHSHNRPPFYFLQRGYVDVRFLTEVFPNFLYPEIEGRQRLYPEIVSLYRRMGNLQQMMAQQDFPKAPGSFMDQLGTVLVQAPDGNRIGERCADFELEKLVNSLVKELDTSETRQSARSMLLPHVLQHLENFGKWICAIYDQLDEPLAQEIVNAAEKIFALHWGNHLAYLFLTCSRRGCLDQSLAEIDARLTAGV